MSLESSPYLPISVSLNSNTGVSMDTAPWRLNTPVMMLNAACRHCPREPSTSQSHSAHRQPACTLHGGVAGTHARTQSPSETCKSRLGVSTRVSRPSFWRACTLRVLAAQRASASAAALQAYSLLRCSGKVCASDSLEHVLLTTHFQPQSQPRTAQPASLSCHCCSRSWARVQCALSTCCTLAFALWRLLHTPCLGALGVKCAW